MRESLQSSLRWLGTGCFLALVYFTAPNCALQTNGLPCEDPNGCNGGNKHDCPPDHPDCNDEPCNDPSCPEQPCDKPDCNMPPDPVTVFQPGLNPTDAIMCDFPNVPKPMTNLCATQAQVDSGSWISASAAATDLANNQHDFSILDWSDASKAECGGLPKWVDYLAGPFPDGAQVCINATSQFPLTYANPLKACIAKCEDVITNGFGPFPADVHDYCVNNARLSTNFDGTPYANACDNGGNPVMGWVDPRRTPEKVTWTDLNGASTDGVGGLTRTAATTGVALADYAAGGASAQTILKGDAWVDVEVTAANQAQFLSLRNSCDKATDCPDMVPGVDDLGYALLFYDDGQVYVNEFNTTPPLSFGGFGPYTVGEHYRVRAVDNHNGSATISYSRLLQPCPTGTFCDEQVFYTSTTFPQYPLRVDAAIRDQNATIANVTIMRIKE